jgi:CheY-like chemotaxis protein
MTKRAIVDAETLRRADPFVDSLPFSPATVGPTDPDPSGVRKQARRRVLVVDDEPLVAVALRRALTAHDVTVAESGAAALAKIAEGAPFDVILCDVMMPGMSGLAVYETATTSHPELRSRFVFVTGGVLDDDARLFLASAPNPVLTKPFDLCAVRDTVRDTSEAHG